MIKTCPFCGQNPTLQLYDLGRNWPGEREFIIQCDTKGCVQPSARTNTLRYNTEDLARAKCIEMWNHRAKQE